MSEYSSLQKAQDAVQFADSRFGKHYLSRLRAAHARCMADVTNIELTDSYRANRASQAAAVQSEITYFDTAKAITSDPNMMQRLRNKVTGKERPDIEL